MRKKPNVIQILADNMGYGEVSALNGECQFETPPRESGRRLRG